MFKRVKELMQPFSMMFPSSKGVTPSSIVSYIQKEKIELINQQAVKESPSEGKTNLEQTQDKLNLPTLLAVKALTYLTELIPGIPNPDSLMNLTDFRTVDDGLYSMQSISNDEQPKERCQEQPISFVYEDSESNDLPKKSVNNYFTEQSSIENILSYTDLRTAGDGLYSVQDITNDDLQPNRRCQEQPKPFLCEAHETKYMPKKSMTNYLTDQSSIENLLNLANLRTSDHGLYSVQDIKNDDLQPKRTCLEQTRSLLRNAPEIKNLPKMSVKNYLMEKCSVENMLNVVNVRTSGHGLYSIQDFTNDYWQPKLMCQEQPRSNYLIEQSSVENIEEKIHEELRGPMEAKLQTAQIMWNMLKQRDSQVKKLKGNKKDDLRTKYNIDLINKKENRQRLQKTASSNLESTPKKMIEQYSTIPQEKVKLEKK